MHYQAFEAGIEVNGQTVWSIVDGMGSFTLVASRFLLAEGIGRQGPDGTAIVDPKAWYPQAAWLAAFEKIGREIGEQALYGIGLAIPRNARFPPSVRDVHTAVQSIDVAYHMNHRREGVELFDPATGAMREGIGHYGYEPVGPRKVISRCNNPYPCAFDRGILTAMARRFSPTARVAHDDTKPCRSRGADDCTYVVTWS